MKLNNTGDRITPIALFFVMFPVIASLWEFSNVLQELIPECHLNGWIMHIPLAGLIELLTLVVVTASQYLLADKIAHWKGWSQPTVCTGIEVFLLLSVALT
jgi:hypothetical protein